MSEAALIVSSFASLAVGHDVIMSRVRGDFLMHLGCGVELTVKANMGEEGYLVRLTHPSLFGEDVSESRSEVALRECVNKLLETYVNTLPREAFADVLPYVPNPAMKPIMRTGALASSVRIIVPPSPKKGLQTFYIGNKFGHEGEWAYRLDFAPRRSMRSCEVTLIRMDLAHSEKSLHVPVSPKRDTDAQEKAVNRKLESRVRQR